MVELGDVGVTIIGHGTAEVVGGVQIVTCNGVTARNDLAVVVSRACPSKHVFTGRGLRLSVHVVPRATNTAIISIATPRATNGGTGRSWAADSA